MYNVYPFTFLDFFLTKNIFGKIYNYIALSLLNVKLSYLKRKEQK